MKKNFLTEIIARDIKQGTYKNRYWSGLPGFLKQQRSSNTLDTKKLRTRFPPDPNGYLHIGHVKSIILNLNLARLNEGSCNLRFDDTYPNPEKAKFIKSALNSIQWLDLKWPVEVSRGISFYLASNYFQHMYEFAKYLIKNDLAYVDSQDQSNIKMSRGNFFISGKDSICRKKKHQV